MTLPPFELHRPASVEEATALLDRYGDGAVLYCGGTELVLLMKFGFADYGHLVSVKGIEDLHVLDADNGQGTHEGMPLRIGAAVTHRRLERSPLVRDRWPALAEMERGVANIRVRSAGTLGGNLCFADPHSDPASFLLAAGAELICRRGSSRRTVPMREFVLGPYQTVLQQGELLAEVRIPALPPGAAMAHHKIAFRERPAATVSCLARVADGSVAEARIAVGSVGPVPVRAHQAEAMLVGLTAEDPSGATLEAAGAAAADMAGAVADLNGSPEYKQNLVRVLVQRCFRDALAQAARDTGALL